MKANTPTTSGVRSSVEIRTGPSPRSAAAVAVASPAPTTAFRQEPIPQPSEPMQFRAIGLIRGRYLASAEQFTKGVLLTTDGTMVDAVLLGRVMSLVKKHIDLNEEHLWVCYPRTREGSTDLHVQIVGVWEPETLQKKPEEEGKAEALKPMRPKSPVKNSTDLDDGFFSVRGEVVFQSLEQDQIVVKIKQAPKPGEEKGRAFKLQLKGNLGPRATRHFWDLKVQRDIGLLMIRDATCIGAMPAPRKPFRRNGPPGRGGGGGGRPPGAPRPEGGAPPRPVRRELREGGEAGGAPMPVRRARPDAPVRSAVPKPEAEES
jgi:hypothetical protein